MDVSIILENWRLIAEIIGAGILAGSLWRAKKLKPALKATIDLLRIVYSAVEESDAKRVKKTTAKTLAVTAAKNPVVAVVDEAVRSVVDPKENIPPIKRFWRRLLKGENLVGVALRIAVKHGISEAAEKVGG